MMNGQQQQSGSLHFATLQQQQGSGLQQMHNSLPPVSSSQQLQQQPYLLQSQNYLEAFGNANTSPALVVSSNGGQGPLQGPPTTANNYQSLPTPVPPVYARKDSQPEKINQECQSMEQMFMQMQQQYEGQIRSLQGELAQLRATLPPPITTTISPVSKSSNTTTKRSQSSASGGTSGGGGAPSIVETYCENIQQKQFSCKNCTYSTKSEASLAIHNTNHLVNQRYLHLPTTVFSVQPSSHRESSPSSYMYPCGECSGKFHHNDLYLHIYQHHTGESPFHCDECDLFFMHYEFLDDHQRSTHMRNHSKKKSRSSSAAAQADSTAAPQLTYYTVLKCSKPFSVLSAISRGMETAGAGQQQPGPWGTQTDGSQEISPMGNYPYHHTAAHKRGRGRGGGGGSSGSSAAAALQNGTTETDSAGALVFKCHFPSCFFIADSKDRLDFHLFAHRNSRFRCPYCPFVSNVLADIKRHVLKGGKHDGQPMFRCPNSCTYTTNCDKSFKEHIKAAHVGKQVDDKELTMYIEELFGNTAEDVGGEVGAT